MMWKEGLLLKLDKIGIGGKLFNWIIQVRIGEEISSQFEVGNGTPQGNVIYKSVAIYYDK